MVRVSGEPHHNGVEETLPLTTAQQKKREFAPRCWSGLSGGAGCHCNLCDWWCRGNKATVFSVLALTQSPLSLRRSQHKAVLGRLPSYLCSLLTPTNSAHHEMASISVFIQQFGLSSTFRSPSSPDLISPKWAKLLLVFETWCFVCTEALLWRHRWRLTKVRNTGLHLQGAHVFSHAGVVLLLRCQIVQLLKGSSVLPTDQLHNQRKHSHTFEGW